MAQQRYDDALQEAQKLQDLTDDALFERLGLRLEDIHNPGGYERSQQFSAPFQQRATDMGGVADLKNFGRLWWKNLEPELMKTVCEPGNADMQKITGKKNVPELAATLATGALLPFGPPAWIIVVATILATMIARTGLDTVCQVWKKSMDQRAKS